MHNKKLLLLAGFLLSGITQASEPNAKANKEIFYINAYNDPEASFPNIRKHTELKITERYTKGINTIEAVAIPYNSKFKDAKLEEKFNNYVNSKATQDKIKKIAELSPTAGDLIEQKIYIIGTALKLAPIKFAKAITQHDMVQNEIKAIEEKAAKEKKDVSPQKTLEMQKKYLKNVPAVYHPFATKLINAPEPETAQQKAFELYLLKMRNLAKLDNLQTKLLTDPKHAEDKSSKDLQLINVFEKEIAKIEQEDQLVDQDENMSFEAAVVENTDHEYWVAKNEDKKTDKKP